MVENCKRISSVAFKCSLFVLVIYVVGSFLAALGSVAHENHGGDLLTAISLISLILYLALFMGTLKHSVWAYWLALLVYGVQIPILSTPSVEYSLFLGAKLFTTIRISSAMDAEIIIGANLLATLGFLSVIFSSKKA